MNYTKGLPLKMFLMLAHRDELKEAIKRMNEDNAKMLEALKEIAERKGAYSSDKLIWAQNTIDSMAEIAEKLINDIEK